jgi:Fe-S-cluster-containing dehydrogenase component
MAKVFIHDSRKCVGCYSCQVACKDEHCGNNWMPYAKPQPETGHFWFRLNKHVLGNTPQVRVRYVAQLCNHCTNPACLAACPEEAIFKRADGLVIIDPAKCNGCRKCVLACPYGNVWFNEELKIAQKCTGCAHLLDRGWPISEPRCVDICSMDDLFFGNEDDAGLSDKIAQAEVLGAEFGTGPNVHYLNLPKRFIAGTVYDPATKEVVKDATCTLSGDSSGTATTDGYGDFWFENLENGTFSITIQGNGKSKTISDISTEENCVGLGDIALE